MNQEVSVIRSFAENLQDSAFEVFRLVFRLPAIDPRAWSDADRFEAIRVAEALLQIEAGVNRTRRELERMARMKPGRCLRLARSRD